MPRRNDFVTCGICGASTERVNIFCYSLYHHPDLILVGFKISMSLNWLWMCIACTHQFCTVYIVYLKLRVINQNGSGPCALTLCTIESQT